MVEAELIEWIKWTGGNRPVPKHWMVQAMSRQAELGTVCMEAGDLIWEHSGAMDDIVAYRVLSKPN